MPGSGGPSSSCCHGRREKRAATPGISYGRNLLRTVSRHALGMAITGHLPFPLFVVAMLTWLAFVGA
jgi:hypothetical protein